ncbi:MAG: peptidoglycan DD-metalloendopeptidase family protein [Actinomycetota bacterium]|nr:peptidoglycan DD-metalloendopeptidase family protein [Actinomycetota bacterium]MDQ5807219.1 peptidoglycan DD-metalloendopeptidase family protein [Actinomycetota bacterium]
MRLRVLIACVLAPAVLWAVLPVPSDGQRLQEKIDDARAEVERKKGTERVLTSDIAEFSRKISVLEARQSRIQADLDAKTAELVRLQDRLREERARLTRLRERLEQSRTQLATRLVEIYKADKPDVLSVVLNSDGFVDLLERGEFIQRIAENDREILVTVSAAKADAQRTEAQLDRLERRQQRVTAIVLERRNEVARVKTDLVGARQAKQNALSNVRHERHEIEEDLEAMEEQQAKIQARLAGVPAGPIREGSGGMIWPVNGPITGVFGEARPGHMHAGLDIAAPEGTPIRAAQSGRVVLLGWTGGYGNYTCVQHSGSLSSCYAHQSRYGTSMGANVSQGQVIGYVGNTGHSFGAHLHFEVRIGGSPVNPMGYL